MILRKLAEGKGLDDKKALCAEIQSKHALLGSLKEHTVENIIQIYKRDQHDDWKVSAEDIISWFDESEESLADFVFNYGDQLFTVSIADMADHDEKLLNAIKTLLKRYNIINDEGQEVEVVTDADDVTPRKPAKLNTLQMCSVIFDWWTETPDRDPNVDISKIPAKDLSGKTFKDPKKLEAVLNELEEVYHELYESLKEEHVCEKCGKSPCICEENVADSALQKAPETIEVTASEPEEKIKESAFTDMLNELIQKEWDLISSLNGVIATFDFEYKEDSKENIKTILDEIVSDTTINIGMLHKVSELVSLKASTLLSAGEEKAEEIIGE